MIERFSAIKQELEWKWRSTYDDTASQNFLMSHANAMIVGPAGLENRQDAWIEVTLMAPQVRYPGHSHAPEDFDIDVDFFGIWREAVEATVTRSSNRTPIASITSQSCI